MEVPLGYELEFFLLLVPLMRGGPILQLTLLANLLARHTDDKILLLPFTTLFQFDFGK